jgi:hypothetical protein
MVFLLVNDVKVEFKEDELYKLSMMIANSKITKKEISQIFKEKTFCN